jgi:aminoglycoside phosphotransferase (APT) family kinase protein
LWRWRPVHRDFYHDQVLVSEGGLSVLDWDDAAMSEPAVDVANFLAHLRLLALQGLGTPDALDDLSAVFLGRYRQLDGGLDPALLRFLQGATLLRLAEIHRPRTRGEWLAERLLEQSELLLGP